MLGLGVAWLSLVATVDRVLGNKSPDIAARWGTGVSSEAALATRFAQPGATSLALGKAERLALRALAREPVNVPAVRALAVAAALRNDPARADRLFGYAERLSRRDLGTQMWLIEERVRRGDIDGALVHYDRALRTVSRARGVLFPVLVSAMANPDVTGAMQRLLARRVAWGSDFLAVMAQAPDASPSAIGQLAIAARLRPGVPAERGPLDAVLQRLVADSQYAAAFDVYRGAVGHGNRTGVRDGGFEADPVLPPFDWSFANETDLSATRERGSNGGRLVLRASNGGSGELAHQLLLLPPGDYRLALNVSGASKDPLSRAAVIVTCQPTGELLRLPLSATVRARLGGSFTVPIGCTAQALKIVASAGLGDTPEGVVIDDLALVRAR